MRKRYIIAGILIICLLVVAVNKWASFTDKKIDTDINDEVSADIFVPFWETSEEYPEFIRYNEAQVSSYPRSYYIRGDNMSNLWDAMDFDNWEISEGSQESVTQYLIFLDFYKNPYGVIIMVDINDTASLYADSDAIEYQMPEGTYSAILSALEEAKLSIREECLELANQLLASPEKITCYTESLMDEPILDAEAIIYDEENVIEFTTEEEISAITDVIDSSSWVSPNMEDVSFGDNPIRIIITKDDIWGSLDVFKGDIVLVYGHGNSLSGDFFRAPEGTYDNVLNLVNINERS